MTDDELRTLVRDAIARHLGGPAAPPAPGAAVPAPLWRAHPSFAKYLVPGGDEEGGACIIEPAVACNHCGYCQSHGH
jgi:hypothetical protein